LNLRHGAYETPALPLSYTAECRDSKGLAEGFYPRGLDCARDCARGDLSQPAHPCESCRLHLGEKRSDLRLFVRVKIHRGSLNFVDCFPGTFSKLVSALSDIAPETLSPVLAEVLLPSAAILFLWPARRQASATKAQLTDPPLSAPPPPGRRSPPRHWQPERMRGRIEPRVTFDHVRPRPTNV
jgi:hypothetical protein